MLFHQDKIIDLSIFNEQFACNLNACKGACCWEGDYGAPLEKEEIQTLERIYPTIRDILSEPGRQAIDKKGVSYYVEKEKEHATTLLKNGACTFLVHEDGISVCGIEKAHQAGLCDFRKPISCHLYPIRVSTMANGFKKLEYDRWDICSAACEKGKTEQIPVYVFAQEAIIRKFGSEFYKDLEQIAAFYEENEPD